MTDQHGPNPAGLIRLYFGAIALAALALAAVGGLLGYSAVPYWDMWDGHLAFFLDLPEAGPGLWWSQHNEHRILLARLLFYADLQWFDGAGWPLIAVNYALMLGNVALFTLALRRALTGARDSLLAPALIPLLAAWLALWMQHENLLWGFQSQFFLAQLLPALALYLLHRAADSKRIDGPFLAACAVGVASLGTMANGVVALPLMTLLALLAHQGQARVLCLTALTTAGIVFYFHDFTPVASHGSLGEALRQDPLELAHYALLYLGSPFHHLAGGGRPGLALATLAGAGLVAVTGYRGVRWLLGPRRLTLEAAMLAFVVYIAGTALASGGGRLIFGLEQALESRYSTPALLAWASLLVACAPALVRLPRRARLGLLAGAGVLSLAMLVLQAQALEPRTDTRFQRQAAALALSLQINDPARIQAIYPKADTPLRLAERAQAAGVTVLAQPPLADARRALDAPVPIEPSGDCIGFLDDSTLLAHEPDYLRVSGWVHAPAADRPPALVQLLDDEGRAVGVALTGGHRPDVAKAVASEARHAGFTGYLQRAARGRPLTVQGLHGPACRGPLPRSEPPEATP